MTQPKALVAWIKAERVARAAASVPAIKTSVLH